jgi:hypothetical protein
LPKSSLPLLRQHPELLLLDSTYKTNVHNMPLFNCCGVTSQNKMFNWTIVFISGETEKHYIGALTALQHFLAKYTLPLPGLVVTDRELALLKTRNNDETWRTVPHILCRWHVSMNVLSNTKRHFPAAIERAWKVYRHPKFNEFCNDLWIMDGSGHALA